VGGFFVKNDFISEVVKYAHCYNGSIGMEHKDLRQSDEWSEYLKLYGIKSLKTSSGVVVRILPVGFTSALKVYRPQNLTLDDLNEIKGLGKKNKAMLIKIEPSFNQDVKVFEKTGFINVKSATISPKTIWIDLMNSEESLWKDMSDSARYSVKRAYRENVIVIIDEFPSEQVLKEFYDMVKKRADEKNYYVQGFEDLKRKVSVFKEKSYLVRAYGNAGDKGANGAGPLLSAKFYLGYKNCVWYLHGGTSDEGQKTKAGYSVCWESIKYFKRAGYRILDWDGIYDERFPGLTKKWKNLTDFKMKFGGKVVVCPSPVAIYNSIILKFFHVIGLDV